VYFNALTSRRAARGFPEQAEQGPAMTKRKRFKAAELIAKLKQDPV
jgi:hypothetical protein